MRKGERQAGDGIGAMEGSLGEERHESVKSNDRVGPKMQSAQLPPVTEFKYLRSTLQSDGDMSTEVKKIGHSVDGTTGGI